MLNNRECKLLAREFIRNTDFTVSDKPVGIIMAGLPGAGKTEFTQELIKGLNTKPLRIDMDEIATHIEGYRPDSANKFRADAINIMQKIYDEVTKKGIDFVLDGTFGGRPAVENVQRDLNHGYTLKIYYIHQNPLVAWRFTQAREKVERRAIDKQGFMDTYGHIFENLRQLTQYKDKLSVSLIIKTDDNKIGNLREDVSDILPALPAEMTRIELEKLLN